MEGIIRTFSNAVYAKLEEKILQNMASVDAAFGTKTEMFKRVFYPCVENDPAEVERVRALLGSLCDGKAAHDRGGFCLLPVERTGRIRLLRLHG